MISSVSLATSHSEKYLFDVVHKILPKVLEDELQIALITSLPSKLEVILPEYLEMILPDELCNRLPEELDSCLRPMLQDIVPLILVPFLNEFNRTANSQLFSGVSS